MLKLFLEAFELGDIAGEAGDARNPSIFIADDIAAVPDVTNFAVGPHDAVFRVVAGLQGFLVEKGERTIVIIGMNGIEPGVGVGVYSAARASPDSLVGRADVQEAHICDVHKPKDIGYSRRKLLEASVAFPKVALDNHSFGDFGLKGLYGGRQIARLSVNRGMENALQAEEPLFQVPAFG